MITDEKLKELRIELLNDTISFFNKSNRSELNNRCTYFMEGKEGCAIGRKIKDKDLCIKLDSLGKPLISNEVFDLLPKELTILGLNFLSSIQQLHDFGLNWDDNGLSENGLYSVTQIKQEFNL